MRNELYAITVLILIAWLVFAVDSVIPASLTDWGLRPRTAMGLIGIPLMPFLHGSLGHLVGNTVSLVLLLLLLIGSRSNHWYVVAGITLISGMLLWLIGRNAIHIGASGLIFGLIAFLLVSGFLEKRPLSLLISFVVALLYGGTLVGGLIPSWGSTTSWEGHLSGVLAGILVAYVWTRESRKASGAYQVGKRSPTE